jgi:micrococcal nuclease
MARLRNKVTPFSRDCRRPPRKRRWRLADPRLYLNAVIVAASLGLIVLPAVWDGAIAAVRPASDGPRTCRIYQVIDGDTARMWCDGEGSLKARFDGFDAPELFSPACAAEFLAATKAKWALRLAIWKASKVDLTRHGTDRYNRTLVTARLDGEPLARRMIDSGFARAYSGGKREGWCA